MEKKNTRATPEKRTASIIHAAFDVFTHEGYAAARMEDIAQKAGVTKGLLYFYYASKQDLFLEVMEQCIAEPIKKEVFYVNPSENMANHIAKSLDFIYAQLLQTPHVFSLLRLLIIEGPHFPEILEYYHSHVVRPGLEMIDMCLKEGVRRGEWQAEQLPDYPQTFMSPLVLFIVWNFTFEKIETLDILAHCEDHKRLIFQALGLSSAEPEEAGKTQNKTVRRRSRRVES